MRINRRQFLKGASASAFLTGTNLLGLATRRAYAATANGRAVVMINLSGGNDYLNMVIPLSDVAGFPQRTRYEQGRPDLAVPTSLLGATQIGNDAVLNHQIALHPQMTGLATLYQEGKLAVVNGVGYPNHSLSHFEAEAAWWAGNPSPQGTGWLGRFLDANLPLDVTHALSFNGDVNPTFSAISADALGVREIARFDLPDDREGEFRDLENRRPAWANIFTDDRDPAELLGKIARAGGNLIDKSALFDTIDVEEWGSRNANGESDLAFQMQQVASALRHDLLNVGSPTQQTGLSFFHAQIGGFDTHSQQGRDDPNAWHPSLMRWISQAMTNFQRDLEDLGLADKVVTLVYSEFGRRIDQNDSGNSAGTDHGTANAMFVMGDDAVLNGGMYGQMPDISNPDEHDNMQIHVDFRNVYASVIAEWLGADPVPLLGGGFTPMGLFVPAP
jgi:uncharacterized protein (DUF1501 family)